MKRFWKLLIASLALLGVVMNTLQSDHILESFSYYTLQSNVLIIAFFGYLAFQSQTRDYTKSISIIKTVLTTGIVITMVIYHFALRPLLGDLDDTVYAVGDLRDSLLHYIVPTVVLIDYFIDHKTQFIKSKALLWVSVQPLSYLGYTIIYTAFGGQYRLGETVYRYPYFFLDIERYGWLGVSAWSIAVLALYFILALIMIKMYKIVHHSDWHKR